MNSEDGTVSPSLPHAVHSPSFNDEHKTWSRPPCFPRGIHYPRSHESSNCSPLERGVSQPRFLGIRLRCAFPNLVVEAFSATTILHVSQRLAGERSSTPAVRGRSCPDP